MSTLFVNTVAAMLSLAMATMGGSHLADAGGDDSVVVCLGQPHIAGPVCAEVESVITDLLP
jgi:hypothetical protein